MLSSRLPDKRLTALRCGHCVDTRQCTEDGSRRLVQHSIPALPAAWIEPMISAAVTSRTLHAESICPSHLAWLAFNQSQSCTPCLQWLQHMSREETRRAVPSSVRPALAQGTLQHHHSPVMWNQNALEEWPVSRSDDDY
jgi:hypothetical protein